MNITRSFKQASKTSWSNTVWWETSRGWKSQSSKQQYLLRQRYVLDETSRKNVDLSSDFTFGIHAEGYKPYVYAAHSSTFNLSGDLSGTFSASTLSHGDHRRNSYSPGGYGGGGCPPYAMYRSKVYGDDGAQDLTFKAEAHTFYDDSLGQTDGNLYSYGIVGSTLDLGGGDDSVSVESTAFAIVNRPINWRIGRTERVYQDITQAHARGVVGGVINMGAGNDRLSVAANHEVEGYDLVTGQSAHPRSDAISLERAKVYMGDGDDSLTLSGNGVHARYSTVDMGAGDDVLTMGGTYQQIQWNTFAGGDGLDTFVFTSHHLEKAFEAGADRMNSLYGEGGVFSREGHTAEQAAWARNFDIQNRQLGSVGNDVSSSFVLNGNTFTDFERIAVAGGVFDTTTSSFI